MNHKSNPKKHFTTIPNEYLIDPNLGAKEKGILTILLSKPKDWNINFKWLASVNNDGIYAVRSAVARLEDANYIHKEMRKTGTKFAGIEYHYFDRPVTPNEFELLLAADQVQDEIRADVTPPEEYPNHQVDLFQAEEQITSSPPARKEEVPSDLRAPTASIPNIRTGKTRMRKTEMRETAPIINTDIKTTEGITTATAPEEKPIPEAEVEPKQQPQSYPATSEINNLLDLIPDRFSNPMTDSLIKQSLSTHTPNQIADAVIYSIDNVKGGKMQFKAYLDKCLRGGFAEGYQAAREVPDTTPVVSSFGAMGTGRYPNGTVTGSEDMDTNILVGIDFMKEMGVTI